VPAGRDQAGREVGKRSEHEQAIGSGRMGDAQELRGLDRVGLSVHRAGRLGPLETDLRSPEDQQVEIELARTPAASTTPAEHALEPLERGQQIEGAELGVGPAGHVEGRDCVPELGLIGHADGCRRVQARHPSHVSTLQGGKGVHGLGERPLRIADVRPEADVRPDPTSRQAVPPEVVTRLPGMRPVRVSILHPATRDGAGPLELWAGDARGRLARHHAAGFEAAGAMAVAVITDERDATFGARLRPLIAAAGSGGVVVLGSGAIPLATTRDRNAFVAAAGDDQPRALANNRYSADVVAIARTDRLPTLPDLPGDNALPRWLDEVAGVPVRDLRRRPRLAFDIDTPLDLVLLGAVEGAPGDLHPVRTALAGVSSVAADRRAELLVTGRASAATIRWLEINTAARVRAWIEERGLRAATRLALGDSSAATTSRPPASILGTLLDRDAPSSFGAHLARFADAAIVDTRVLLAHRMGPDEAAWPPAEDRYASDLLLPSSVADPWLRELTAAAATAPIPILLGGHSLVGPGIRFVIGGPPRSVPWR